ncbi:MAG: YfhO family protein [[Eubacterium] siraeum]|nr:YfhO family protein [[Eubacterium] siraeum]
MASEAAAENITASPDQSKLREYLGYARNGIKHFIVKENQMWLSFLLPALILLVCYFVFGVWPFGEESVLSLDLNGQYVYYYDHMYDVLAGKESVFYSWNRNLSGEWMGIMGYYLGSPFNFIVWAFPRHMILEGLLTMMCVKVGAIGLCCSVYLSRAKKFSKLTAIIFSVCYALCAYTIVQTMNPMWLDGVMALPIICLSIEKFIDKGKFRLLVVSWVYAFVTCFYIGFMLAIFSIIYYIFYMVITENEAARDHFIKKSLTVLGLGITAVMISCFMLIPVYESLSYGKFEFSVPDYSLKENFQLIELFDKIIPNSYDTVRMTGLPFLYCGIITVLLLPAYFLDKKIRTSQKIGYGAVMLLLVFCMYTRPVDMIWHGGQLPNWLPYRYSFMLSFLMIVCAASAFEHLKEVKHSALGVTAAAWIGMLIYQESMDNYVPDLNNGRDTLGNFTAILPAIIIIFTITAVLLTFGKNLNFSFERSHTRIFSIILIAIICSEAAFNTLGQISTQDTDITYSNHDTYVNVIPAVRDKVNEIKAQDDGFYRIEKNFFRTVNDPLATGMYGLSHSSSTLNAKPIELLKRLGFTSRSHYTRYSGHTMITSSLFGVKYELSTENNTTTDVKNGGEITYEVNPYAMPICYLGRIDILDIELVQYDPFDAQTQLLNTLTGFTSNYFVRVEDMDLNTLNVTQGFTGDDHHSYKKVDENQTASLTYTFKAPKTGELFMYLPSTYERTVNVTVNDVGKGNYFEGDNNFMKSLGEFTEGEDIRVVLTLTRENLYFREAEFAVIDEHEIENALYALLSSNKDTVCTKPSPTTVRTEVNCPTACALLTTIPVEKGWTVYVDGVKTEYREALGALIAVPLTAGQHTVEMKFMTAGYPAAVVISVSGLIIFVGIILLWLKNNPADRKNRKAHLMKIYSGEALQELKQQKAEQLEERKRLRELEYDKEDEEEASETEESASNNPDEEEIGENSVQNSEEKTEEDPKNADNDLEGAENEEEQAFAPEENSDN